MESQPQNPEFRNNPENFHPCLNWLFRHWHKKLYRENLTINMISFIQSNLMTEVVFYCFEMIPKVIYQLNLKSITFID